MLEKWVCTLLRFLDDELMDLHPSLLPSKDKREPPAEHAQKEMSVTSEMQKQGNGHGLRTIMLLQPQKTTRQPFKGVVPDLQQHSQNGFSACRVHSPSSVVAQRGLFCFACSSYVTPGDGYCSSLHCSGLDEKPGRFVLTATEQLEPS